MASHDPTFMGGWFYSSSSCYRIESILWQGSSGKVAKGTRMSDSKTVAIKMMKDEGMLAKATFAEVRALLKLKSLDSDKCNLVCWYDFFIKEGYSFLVFEHLDKSLHRFMAESSYQPLHLKEIRPIVQQLATALHHLKSIGMTHADLKMENVMLVNHVQEPFRVKLIDFGMAAEPNKQGAHLQTIHYRSPEIILGLPYNEAIDMWSLGCLAVLLYLGSLLYPSRSEYDMMKCIVETQGQLPDHLLDRGLKTHHFFWRSSTSPTSHWKLKTPDQIKAETGVQPVETKRTKLSCLHDLMTVWKPAETMVANNDRMAFVDLLKGMLQLDAAKRFTPSQVLEHPFIIMPGMNPKNPYVKASLSYMEICQKKTPASDSWKAVCRSVQQPSSRTARPVQQYLPCPSAKMRGLDQPTHIFSHPYSLHTSTAKAGMKREADDDDGAMRETFHPSKRVESSWHMRHLRKLCDLMASHDPTFMGGWFYSSSSCYRIESILGQGSYGKVAKGTRMSDSKTVAIKMMKDEGMLAKAAFAEVRALLKLKSLDSDKCNLVCWYDFFINDGYSFLVFEHLDKNLHRFMAESSYQPLHLKEIRPIVQQLATALHHLKSIGMTHADLKMENVMLVNHVQEPFRVKLIDFGMAAEPNKQGAHLQTIHYRSPEIILGLPYNEAIDMWSLGCLAVLLYLGSLLYPSRSEYDMMKCIVETQGQLPDHLLDRGLKTRRFFQRINTSPISHWKLKTPDQIKAETGVQPVETKRTKLSCLHDLMTVWKPAETTVANNDRMAFVDLVKGMLQLNATKRFTPHQVLEHPFISMPGMNPKNPYVNASLSYMEICQKKTPASDSCKAVCRSVQQPSSRTARPVQQYLPCPSAKMRGPDRPTHIVSHPSSGTQDTSTAKAGIKREADDEDGAMIETFHPSKRVESSWHIQNCAAPSTSSSSTSITATPLAQAHPSKMSQSHNPGVTRTADNGDVGHRHADSDYYTRSDDGVRRFWRSSPVDPSTYSSSSRTPICDSPRDERRTAHYERNDGHEKSRHMGRHIQPYERKDPYEHHHHHHHHTHVSDCAQTEIRARSELKRRAADDEDVLHDIRTDLRADMERKRSASCSEEIRMGRRDRSPVRDTEPEATRQASRGRLTVKMLGIATPTTIKGQTMGERGSGEDLL